MTVDDTDRRIVNALLKDGRASSRDIAAEAGVAATTVTKRLSALEDRGIVDSYHPAVDYDALGYDVTAVFRLGVKGSGLAPVVDRLRDHDQMVGVYEVTGSHDVIAIGKFDSTDELNTEIKDLLTNPKITATNTNVVLETVREYEQFPLDLENGEA
ncbi:HTH-type transcriptional regulator Lrp [Halorientalis brevis]|uniref:HTH-type transcriptional regulator Lrp n=1 Tax=Halorientalis brevis TaxID=1126241 RepID=A0ABD6C9D8_9EURY|nr:HTH-type transcriptional regulator Lrp [Halorientalis brevis]